MTITASSLIVSLENLRAAKTEQDCAAALVFAAAQLQEAVLEEQDPKAFHAALDACPDGMGPELMEAMARAVNFHLLESGGTLGLWLLPVVVSANTALPMTLQLETNTVNALKMSGCLLQQLGLSAKKTGGNRTGWTFVLPTLYAEEELRNVDFGDLIRLPQDAREFVLGQRKTVTFNVERLGNVEPGANLYFLPFVAFCPDGLPPTMPLGSDKTRTRLSQWVTATLSPALGDAVSVTVAHVPQPFSLALRVGARLCLDVSLRETMVQVCNQSGVEPNGLAALVAPYATRTSDGSFMVGVSLVSRLTRNVVATLALPVETEDGAEEVALVTHILKSLGMDCIQDVRHPIDTIACQHCGRYQFVLPSAEVAQKGLTADAGKCVH